MYINGEKTKILTVGVTVDQSPLKLKEQMLEEVESFSYLGSEVCQSTKVERGVMVRLKKAGTVYQMWRWKVFRSRNLSKDTKLVRYHSKLVKEARLLTAKMSANQMRKECHRDIHKFACKILDDDSDTSIQPSYGRDQAEEFFCRVYSASAKTFIRPE